MWTGRHTVILGAASVVSLVVGSASGYLYARRVLGAQFEERLEKELKETRLLFQNIHKDVDAETLAREILDVEEEDLQKYDTRTSDIPQEVLDAVRRAEEELGEEAEPLHSAFENPAPSWVQEDEELERRNGVPYVISEEEYLENQWEHEEGNLTFYEGDDVLADSRDEVIPSLEDTLGLSSAELSKKWGHGCQDPNIVFICNEKMGMNFEVARSTKSYAEDVLGFIPDEGKTLKHSARRDFRRGLDE